MKGLEAPKASLGSVTGIHMEAQTSARAVDRAQARLGNLGFLLCLSPTSLIHSPAEDIC